MRIQSFGHIAAPIKPAARFGNTVTGADVKKDVEAFLTKSRVRFDEIFDAEAISSRKITGQVWVFTPDADLIDTLKQMPGAVADSDPDSNEVTYKGYKVSVWAGGNGPLQTKTTKSVRFGQGVTGPAMKKEVEDQLSKSRAPFSQVTDAEAQTQGYLKNEVWVHSDHPDKALNSLQKLPGAKLHSDPDKQNVVVYKGFNIKVYDNIQVEPCGSCG